MAVRALATTKYTMSSESSQELHSKDFDPPSLSAPRKDSLAPHYNPIFGTTPQILQSASTLMRLTLLDDALPKNRSRSTVVDQLAKIWLEGGKQASMIISSGTGSTDLDSLKALMSGQLKQLGSRLTAIYAEELEAVTTAAELNKCALRFFKDTNSIQIAPLQKSFRGVNGPTFLVSYPRLDNQLQTPQLHQYVVKWTQWTELCSARIYDGFSRSFSLEGPPSTFIVPKASGIDFERGVHEMPDCSQTLLSTETVDKLRQKFLGVVQAVDSKITPQDNQIMLLERIPGSNLFDFAKTKYQDLSQDQKEKLFTRLGRLAMLDVLMGNTDRLIQVFYHKESSSYDLVTYESNLGNAMIVWSSELQFPELFAIDNGIDEKLIHDPEYKAKYLAFLDNILKNPKMTELLTDAMTKSVKSAISLMAEDEDDDLVELRKRLKPFVADLESLGQSAIANGIAEMKESLRTTLIPKWDSEDNAGLISHLKWAHPELLEAVKERLETFNSSVRK